jgi:hypothetical protein
MCDKRVISVASSSVPRSTTNFSQIIAALVLAIIFIGFINMNVVSAKEMKVSEISEKYFIKSVISKYNSTEQCICDYFTQRIYNYCFCGDN